MPNRPKSKKVPNTLSLEDAPRCALLRKIAKKRNLPDASIKAMVKYAIDELAALAGVK